ncbi:mitochondrial peptide methionine sulfoxide reductase [Triplophysa rosa]|uniref:peptide-methionine (S)-S-oxide reductase n=1 Tax=Triplophysa rosa TaxID=992332 RepID=A0A9W7WH43_TRIRA|nr:mitochondrial peptide methionine sulfoxide reductase [Triplophysa rosa]
MVARTPVRLFWRSFIHSRMGDMSFKVQMPSPEEALPGREQSMKVSGMGCFWGAERKFWRQKGVYSTQVGYSGGYTPNPTYEEVCSGKTGHTELVRVVYEAEKISFAQLLKVFWESHNPTQGMRQGNDVGTTYRSAIYAYTHEQLDQASHSKDEYQKVSQRHLFISLTSMHEVTHLKTLRMLVTKQFFATIDYHSRKNCFVNLFVLLNTKEDILKNVGKKTVLWHF